MLTFLRCMGLWSFTIPSLMMLIEEARAQIPSEIVGRWSTDEVSCEDNQDGGVTIFRFGPTAIGWYDIGCDVNNVRSKEESLFLKVTCGKANASLESGNIEIRRLNQNILDVQISTLSFSSSSRYRLTRCEQMAE